MIILSSIVASAWTGGGSTSNYHGAGRFTSSGVGMISFGTISGGVGAQLTGGNFWQGAVTGLVVSGLNHYMHKMVEKDAFAKRFHNVDPDAVPEKNIESVNKLLDDVDGLSGVYKISGKPSIDVTGQNNISVLAETSQNSNGSTTVKLYNGAFKSNYKLASVLFHEFYHSYQYISGVVDYAQNRFKIGAYYNQYGFSTKSQAWLEARAYEFQIRMGDSSQWIQSNYQTMLKFSK
jgi:hypothetical protein